MLAFLLAANLAATIWLIAAAPTTFSGWYASVLPGWIQAIGTTFAVGIAYRAYKDWWQADLARAKSRDAEDLMDVLQDLTETLMQSQSSFVFTEPLHSVAIQKALTDKRRDQIRLIRERSRELKRKWPRIRDAKLAQLVVEFADLGDELNGAFLHLENMAPLLDQAKSAVEISGQVRRYLVLLGGLPHGSGMTFPNEFQQRVLSQRLAINRLLQAHLRYEEPPQKN